MANAVKVTASDGVVRVLDQKAETVLPSGPFTVVIERDAGYGFNRKSDGRWVSNTKPVVLQFDNANLESGSYWFDNMGPFSISVAATSPPPVPVDPTEIDAGEAPVVLHFTSTTEKKWGNGDFSYNTAYLLEEGVYTVEGKKYRVRKSSRTIIRPGPDNVLPAVIPPNAVVVLDNGKTYTLPPVNNWKSVSVGTNSGVICPDGVANLIGPLSGAAFETNDKAFFIGLSCTSNVTSPEKVGPDFFLPNTGTSLLIKDCIVRDVNHFVNGNRKPSGVLVLNCISPDDLDIRSYLAWVEGEKWVIRKCSATNSTREHIVRVSNDAKYLFVVDCDFGNKEEKDSGVPGDMPKGTLVMQVIQYATVDRCVLRGPCGPGPLKAPGTISESNKKQRANNVSIRNTQVLGATVYVNHGSNDILLENLYIESGGVAGIEIDGYDATWERGNERVTVRNCTVIGGYLGIPYPTKVYKDQHPTGFINIGPKAKAVLLEGNTFYSEHMRSGWGGAGVVAIGKDAEVTSLNNNWGPTGLFKLDGDYVAVPVWSVRTGGRGDKVVAVERPVRPTTNQT